MAVRSTFSSDERGHKSASLIRKLSQREPLTGESWFSLVDGQQKMNSVTFSEVFFMLICLLMFFFSYPTGLLLLRYGFLLCVLGNLCAHKAVCLCVYRSLSCFCLALCFYVCLFCHIQVCFILSCFMTFYFYFLGVPGCLLTRENKKGCDSGWVGRIWDDQDKGEP